jgi:hypothetical protein
MKFIFVMFIIFLTGCSSEDIHDFAKGFNEGPQQSSYHPVYRNNYYCLQQCDENTSWCWKSARDDNHSYGYDSAMSECFEASQRCKTECNR